MKSYKQVICGALVAAVLSTVSQANAATVFRITGSTAYRGAVVAAIHHLAWTGLAYAYTGSAATSGLVDSGADAAIYTGTLNSTAVEIDTSWSGSEAGVQAVAQVSGTTTGINVSFVSNPPTTGGGAGTATLTSGGTAGIDDPVTPTAGGSYVSAIPDACMADTFQNTSIFHGNSIDGKTYATLQGAGSGDSLGSGIVGVVPFEWVVTTATNVPFTNITDSEIKYLYANGVAGKALFTGSSADEGKLIYATGRNPDSGTRLTAFADSGLGATSSPFQYEPLASGTAGYTLVSATGSVISKLVPWPADTVNGISYPNFGQSGFNSGGKLAGAMGSQTSGMIVTGTDGTTVTGTGGELVAYLSTGDAGTATKTSAGNTFAAAVLSYNGYALASDFHNLYEGQYTFWSYEHMYYRKNHSVTNPISSAAQTVADAIAVQLDTADSTVLTSNMHSQRAADGALVNPLGY